MRDCKGEHCTHYHGKKYPQHTTQSPTAAISRAPEPFTGKTKERHAMIPSPTLPSIVKTSSDSPASPLTSEVLDGRSEVVVNTPESSENLPFTTSVPMEAKVETVQHSTIQSTARIETKLRKEQTSEDREEIEGEEETFVEKQTQQFSTTKRSPLSTENTKRTTVSVTISKSQRNVSNHFITNERPDKEQINVEKPSQGSVSAVAGSDDVPTTEILARSSKPDTSPSETNVPSFLPTSASTTLTNEKNANGMNLKERFTVKPTRGKASKRRKHGQREARKREKDTHTEKQRQKILKKSRKSKKKSSARESSLVPTENTKEFKGSKNQTVAPEKTSESWKNLSNHFSENFENKRPNKVQTSVEKPSEDTVTSEAGSNDLPTTVLGMSSESVTSSLETNISSILPTFASTTLTREENTSGMNLQEHFTVKPTKTKSVKRRKHGERENYSPKKETPKTSKKLRKAKKKLSEKQIPLTTLNSGSSDENKQTIKTAENQTRVESKVEGESGSELETKGNENGNESLKRNKKPTSKRSSHRNSKRRSKQRPPKRQRPTQISAGGVAEGGVEPSVQNGAGLAFEQTPPSSEP